MTEKQYTLTLTEDRAEWVYNALMAYRAVSLYDEAEKVKAQMPKPWKVGDWFFLEDIGYRCRIVDINLGRVAYHWRHKDGTPSVAWDWVEMLDDAEHREPPLSWEGDR